MKDIERQMKNTERDFEINYHRHGQQEWQVTMGTKVIITKKIMISVPIESDFILRKGKQVAVFYGTGSVNGNKELVRITRAQELERK